MKKLKFLACAMLTVFCLSTYTMEAQTVEQKQRRGAAKEQRIERQPMKKGQKITNKGGALRKAALKNDKASLLKKSTKGEPIKAEADKIKSTKGLKKAEERKSVKRTPPSPEVVSATEAIKKGKKKGVEMRKKIAAAKLKFEQGKKTGKYSKEEIAAKEAKLKAAELKVKELEQTLKEESSKLSKATRGLK